MTTEMLDKYQRIADFVDSKANAVAKHIAQLQEEIDILTQEAIPDLSDYLDIFRMCVTEANSMALNELLKLGVVPDAKIVHKTEGRIFRCKGYLYDTVVFVEESANAEREFKANLVRFLKIKDRWEVVK